LLALKPRQQTGGLHWQNHTGKPCIFTGPIKGIPGHMAVILAEIDAAADKATN